MLCTDRPQILAAEPADGVDVAEVWRAASAVLHGRSVADLAAPGRGGAATSRLEPTRPPATRARGGPAGAAGAADALGRVTVGRELDPLADALVDAARATGARVLLTRHASVAELVPRADEVLADDAPLAEHVQRLQRDGHGVLVVSGADDQALAVADVGIAVLGGRACVCWSADVLCGPGLEDVVADPARGRGRAPGQRRGRCSSRRPVRRSGALLALVGGRRGGRPTRCRRCTARRWRPLSQGTVAGLVADPPARARRRSRTCRGTR